MLSKINHECTRSSLIVSAHSARHALDWSQNNYLKKLNASYDLIQEFE